MYFSSTVEGPLDIGAMMVAFVETYDEGGNLFNPPGAVVHVTAEDSEWEGVYLTPGDKGAGKCEYAPLMGPDTVYLFQVLDGTQVEYPPISDVARCDLGVPFAGDKPVVGQLHKSFYVRFTQGDGPPPPDPDPDSRIAELEAALRDQGRRWGALFESVGTRAENAQAAIDLVLPEAGA